MNTSTSTDAIVIGAGVVGASCAYHLARAGLNVIVAETFGGPAEGSTGRSFASIRSQWADPLNIEMSLRSIRTFPRARSHFWEIRSRNPREALRGNASPARRGQWCVFHSG